MKSKKLVSIIIGIAVICLVGVFGIFKMNTSAVADNSEKVAFSINEGDTLGSIVANLENEGIIKSATFGKIVGKMHGNTEFQVGAFEVDKSWDTGAVLAHLNDPNNIIKDEKLVTFKEGMWAIEIARTLGNDKTFDVTEKQLLDCWNNKKFLKECINKYEFLDESILNKDTKVKLEGFLYPETYCLPYHASAKELTYIFLDQFDSIYQTYKDDIKKSDFTIYQLVTLASMVQYEASTVEDMKLISGVFHNRLKESMALGSSVTVCYAIYDDLDKSDPDSWKKCEANFDIESPYNTYKIQGLPVGPIENPGKEAIDAALHPTESDYLYFMADVEGDGKVYYAKTLEEHNANVNKYLGY